MKMWGNLTKTAGITEFQLSFTARTRADRLQVNIWFMMSFMATFSQVIQINRFRLSLLKIFFRNS